MKWTARTARRVPRAVGRTAALFGMLAAGGLAAGVASASGSHPTAAWPATVSLIYRCRFPAGPHPVTVGVTATVPAAAKTGGPIRPAGVTLTMALPSAAVSALASLHSTTVGAVTRLTVSASEGQRGTSVVWPGITRRPAHRPAHGSLTLTTAGTVPSVTASSAGEVVLTAAGLSITFTGGEAAAPAPGPARSPMPTAGGQATVPTEGGQAVAATPTPTAAAPATGPVQVTCALAPGQRATLATVAIAGKPAATSRHAPVTSGKCPPHGKLKLNPRFPPPKPPPDAPRINAQPFPGCAWVVGYSDVRKLNGAALVGPALSDVLENVRVFFRPPKGKDKGYLQLDNVIQLENHGKHEFPPSTATFLSFGFVPTSATMHIVELGTIDAYAVGAGESCNTCQQTTTVFTHAQLRVDNVHVNGVPLDVGPACQTPPFDIVVVGSILTKPPYTPDLGGPLTGMVTIPKFHGCGVGENVDPIFNAAISGKRNFTLLTQGVLCNVNGGVGCDQKGLPVIPTPLRKVTG
jgi:Family of unknown function (DUF6801)